MKSQVCPKDGLEITIQVPVEVAVRQPPFRRISMCHTGENQASSPARRDCRSSKNQSRSIATIPFHLRSLDLHSSHPTAKKMWMNQGQT
jgi:hypothetical protein